MWMSKAFMEGKKMNQLSDDEYETLRKPIENEASLIMKNT